MILAKIFFWTVGIMFFVGMVGSAIVVTMTSIDDVRDMRVKDDHDETSSRPTSVRPVTND